MKVSRSSIVLLVGIVVVLVYINFQNNSELTFDAARHACGGHFYYDYFRTILSGRLVSIPRFLDEYSQKGYNIGWYALYDPPFYGMSQAMVFLFLGDSKFNVKFTNQLFLVIAVIFVYLIASKIFKSRKTGLVCALFYAIIPFNYTYSRNGYDPLGFIGLTLGWYYFFFVRDPKMFRVKLSSSFSFSLNLNVLIAGFFFAAATLVKYHTAVYVAAFGVVYGAVLVFRAFMKSRSFSFRVLFVESQFSNLLKNMVIIGLILLLVGWWWIKFSVIDQQMFDRMTWMVQRDWQGYGYPSDWPYTVFMKGWVERIFYTPLSLMYYTAFLLPLALVPLFLRKKHSWHDETLIMLYFACTVYFVNTFLMTDHKFRYVAHLLPFAYFFMWVGIVDLAGYLKEKFHVLHVLPVLLAVFLVPILIISMQMKGYEMSLYGFGKVNNDLAGYFNTKPDPKLLINVKGYDLRQVVYSHNPDLFIFTTMTINREFDPLRMQQYSQYFEWIMTEPEYKSFAREINRTSYQIPVYLAMFKYEPDHKIEKLGTELEQVYDFKVTNFTYYYVYENFR
jgi:4-amino-4-deoxy-L-arabinose transferase-like glycosyltransferase